MTKYYYKGQLSDSLKDLALNPLNRGFLYGDGFFETMMYSNSKIFNESAHIARIEKSSKLLGNTINGVEILEEIKTTLAEISLDSGYRLRITFFRNGSGFYCPEHGAKWDWVLSISEYEDSRFALNNKGLKIGIFSDQPKAAGGLSNIKSTSAQIYVQAAKYGKMQSWDDTLIINSKGNIIESTISNIFAIKSGYLFTPSLSEGPVVGTMRSKILQLAHELGLTASSGPLEKNSLIEADEILLSNAITGIRWVENFEGKKFNYKYAPRVIELLNKELLD